MPTNLRELERMGSFWATTGNQGCTKARISACFRPPIWQGGGVPFGMSAASNRGQTKTKPGTAPSPPGGKSRKQFYKLSVQLTPSLKIVMRRGTPTLLFHDEPYGPKDLINPYPSWGQSSAVETVIRAYKAKQPSPFTLEQVALIKAYLGQWPDGPQLP